MIFGYDVVDLAHSTALVLTKFVFWHSSQARLS